MSKSGKSQHVPDFDDSVFRSNGYGEATGSIKTFSEMWTMILPFPFFHSPTLTEAFTDAAQSIWHRKRALKDCIDRLLSVRHLEQGDGINAHGCGSRFAGGLFRFLSLDRRGSQRQVVELIRSVLVPTIVNISIGSHDPDRICLALAAV